MKKFRNSKPFCFLLVLMLLMQSMTVPVYANDDGTCEYDYCCDNQRPETISGYPATCTEKGLADGVKCASCNTILVEQIPTDPLNHMQNGISAIVPMDPVAPTCTQDGYGTGGKRCTICGVTVVLPEEIYQAKGHTAEVIPAIPAGCEAGWTEGAKCSVCGEMLIAPV